VGSFPAHRLPPEVASALLDRDEMPMDLKRRAALFSDRLRSYGVEAARFALGLLPRSNRARIVWLVAIWSLTLAPFAPQLGHTYVPYLDMASGAVYGSAGSLINLYWSPLYPALQTVWLAVFRPAPYAELKLIYWLNWLIFLASCCSFGFLCSSWLRCVKARNESDSEGRSLHGAAAFCGFGVFLWTVTRYCGIDWGTPDLCVVSVIFLAAGIGCRLCVAGSGWGLYVALGCVLGLGYYAKAAMLPIGLLLLVSLLFFAPSAPAKRRGLALAAAVLLFSAGPLVYELSRRAGRFTTGDAGSLNYAWYVNGVRPFFWPAWTGGPAGCGVPAHAPLRLFESPLTLEFGTPTPGTCSYLYDPSYWYKGVQPRFDFKRQVQRLWSHVDFFLERTAEAGLLIGAALALCALGWRNRRRPPGAPSLRWMVAWPLAAIAMYAAVHVESRFIGGLVVVFWLGVLGALFARVGSGAVRIAALALGGGLLVPALLQQGFTATQSLKDAIRSSRPAWYLSAASDLARAGIGKGDGVASVGADFPEYSMHLLGARLVALIPDEEAPAFWRMSPPELERLKDVLRRRGVKALVTGKDNGIGAGAPSWFPIAEAREGSYWLCPL
jgi:hypothetical protein